VFADRYVVRVLDRADNAPGLDPKAVVTAARSRFPWWLPILVTSRFVMVTAGSLLVLVLVSLPSHPCTTAERRARSVRCRRRTAAVQLAGATDVDGGDDRVRGPAGVAHPARDNLDALGIGRTTAVPPPAHND